MKKTSVQARLGIPRLGIAVVAIGISVGGLAQVGFAQDPETAASASPLPEALDAAPPRAEPSSTELTPGEKAAADTVETPIETPTPVVSPAESPTPSPSPMTLQWPVPAKKSLAPWKATLPKKPSKAARDLARATQAFEKKKYAEARKLVTPLRGDSKFADHALIILGRSFLAEAQAQLAKKPADAETSAQKAVQNFEKVRSEHLLSPWYSRVPEWIGEAEMVRGMALVDLKKRKPAMTVFERGFQRLLLANSLHLASPDALDAYAESCAKKRGNLCESWILRLANQYAKNTLESRTLASHFKEIVDQSKPNFANSKITTGYKQKDSDEIAFEEAFKNVLDKHWGSAVKSLQKFIDEYPRSTHRFRARFWLGRSVEEDDNLKKARPHYEMVAKDSPLTLYGLLSQWKLGLDPLTRYSGAAPTLQENDVFQTPQELLGLERARELVAAGAHELAAMDLRDLRPRNTASGGYLLYLAGISSLSGSYLASFIQLTELIQRSDEIVYSQDALDLVFPIVDEAIIRKHATASDLDPLLVLSLIKQESGFEKGIHSSVGASGYMQLMPFTASDVEVDVKREDLLDPDTNVRVGTKYLRRMLNRYNGNVALALAAYNAGPGAADRWVREGRADQGVLEFIERIPYKETREYVGTIFRNYVYYQRRLAGKVLTSTESFWPAGWTPKK